MFVLLEKFDTNAKKQVIVAGDFTLFFDSKLDAQDGNPTIKKKSLAKLVELKENYDLCDIWRVRNTKSKRFTFAQERSSSKYSSKRQQKTYSLVAIRGGRVGVLIIKCWGRS